MIQNQNACLQTFDQSIENQLSDYLLKKVGYENFKPGLERLRPLFEPFKKKLKSKKIITIAGTNGKGEVALTLSSLLSQQGYKVATWTSPHILSLRERFLSSHGQISYQELNKILYEFESLSSELSYYEYLFYCFCYWASELESLDYVILEVGLGGRFDAVNLFDADLCAITSISLDHQDILGDNLEKILLEKVGITRAGIPLISALEQPELRHKLREVSLDKGFPLKDIFLEGRVQDSSSYRERNWELSVALFKELFPACTVEEIGLKPRDIQLKGRFEMMTLRRKRFIFIGAHNLDGWLKMRPALLGEDLNKSCSVLVSFSKRPEEELQAGLELMQGWDDLVFQVVVSHFNHQKAANGKVLESMVQELALEEGILSFVDIWQEHVFNKINEDASEDVIVMGSYYFIGEVQKYLLSLNL